MNYICFFFIWLWYLDPVSMSGTHTIGCVSITTWILRLILCAFLSICLFLFCVKTFWDCSRFKEFMCNFFIIIFSCKVKFCVCVCIYICIPCFSFLTVPTNTMGFGFKLNTKWGFQFSLIPSPILLSSFLHPMMSFYWLKICKEKSFSIMHM